MHSECASISEAPEEKCICTSCSETSVVLSETKSSTPIEQKMDMDESMELGTSFVFSVFECIESCISLRIGRPSVAVGLFI